MWVHTYLYHIYLNKPSHTFEIYALDVFLYYILVGLNIDMNMTGIPLSNVTARFKNIKNTRGYDEPSLSSIFAFPVCVGLGRKRGIFSFESVAGRVSKPLTVSLSGPAVCLPQSWETCLWYRPSSEEHSALSNLILKTRLSCLLFRKPLGRHK